MAHQYYSFRGRRGHRTTVLRHFSSALILPVVVVFVASFLVTGVVVAPAHLVTTGSALLAALGASVLRLFGAYALSILVGIPLGLLAEANPRVESFLLPIYDVMESLPVLAFFPVLILFFLQSGFLEGAAVFIIFFSIVWTVAFSTIAGMKAIPKDVQLVGRAFGLSAVTQFFTITLPALYPPLLTASILGIADGWNIVIVAEALHAYAPQSGAVHDLFGIGSILVTASTAGETTLLISAMTVLVVFVAVMNLVIWQPLLSRVERYKFD